MFIIQTTCLNSSFNLSLCLLIQKKALTCKYGFSTNKSLFYISGVNEFCNEDWKCAAQKSGIGESSTVCLDGDVFEPKLPPNEGNFIFKIGVEGFQEIMTWNNKILRKHFDTTNSSALPVSKHFSHYKVHLLHKWVSLSMVSTIVLVLEKCVKNKPVFCWLEMTT